MLTQGEIQMMVLGAILAMGGAMAAIVRLVGRREWMSASAVREEASRRGWRMTWRPERALQYRLEGVTGGIRWKIERERPHPGRSSTAQTGLRMIWSTDAVEAAETFVTVRDRVLVRPLQASAGRLALRASRLLAAAAAGSLGHDSGARLREQGKRLEFHDRALNERYELRALDEASARCVITPQLEAQLRDDASRSDPPLAISVGGRNLRIQANYLVSLGGGDVDEVALVTRFVGLGVLLARNCLDH